eukprot:m.61003 g.61003  ORF g.61003 m.61003 type:complete len:562 (+) comp49419_c0_seq1:137-1822(+)
MIRTSRSVCHFCAILSFILDRSETQFDSAPRIIRHTASKSPCDFVKGSPDLDSKYAWLVCLTGFIANAVGVGVIVAFAIYIPLLSEKLNASESDVSWAGSICLCINNGAGLFVGKLLSKYGAKISSICAAVLFFLGFFLTGYATAMWHVYITYGVMIGIASCIVFLQAVVVVGQFFERRRSIALGLAIAGVGVGMMIIPHITEALVDSFGWRSAFKIQGVYCAVVVALTALVYRSTRAPVKEAGQLEGEDLTSQSSEDPEYIEIVPAGMSPVRYWHFHRTYTELLFDKTVLLFVISLALYAFSSFIPTLYIVSYAIEKLAVSSSTANWTVSIMGLLSTCGRISIGPICDWAKPRGHMVGLFVTVILVNATSIALLPTATNMGGLSVLCAIFGYTSGASVTLMPVLIEYFVEPKDVAKTLGLVSSAQAPGFLIGSPIAGMITSSSGGSYTPAFLMSAGVLAFSTVFMMLISLVPRSPKMIRADTSRFFALTGMSGHQPRSISQSSYGDEDDETRALTEAGEHAEASSALASKSSLAPSSSNTRQEASRSDGFAALDSVSVNQ